MRRLCANAQASAQAVDAPAARLHEALQPRLRRVELPRDLGGTEDLTQEFFYPLLEGQYLSQVDPSRGRFRSFLFVSIDHFPSNSRDRVRAMKRGGHVQFLSFDQLAEESRTDLGYRTDESPEKNFERRWAMTFLAAVLDPLRGEGGGHGRGAEFEPLKPFLVSRHPEASCMQVVPQLGLSEATLRTRVPRLRRRYAELVQIEVVRTVQVPADAADESRHLRQGLSA